MSDGILLFLLLGLDSLDEGGVTSGKIGLGPTLKMNRKKAPSQDHEEGFVRHE